MEIGSIIEIDFSNLEKRYCDGDYSSYNDFGELIDEHEGHFDKEQFLCYNLSDDDVEILLNVYYNLEVRGYHSYCPGDFWTPPDSSLEIQEINVTIVGVDINETELELCKDLENKFVIFIEKKIGI